MPEEKIKKTAITTKGGIISAYVAAHYIKELNHLGIFKQRAQKSVNTTLEDLKEIEINFFDLVYNSDTKDVAGITVTNYMVFIDKMLAFNFNDFTLLQEQIIAFSLDKKAMKASADAVLKEHGVIEI
jgi:hypothetical protein